MEVFGQNLAVGSACFLFLALLLAISFEFVNGFHDTANAVATVIYTRTLSPVPAVIWSGCWNLIGVLMSDGGVAFSIVGLLPVNLVLNIGSAPGFAMVFSLLISAIIWNIGTWYLGLPASSSHTLIGSIMGVGLANSLMAGHPLSEGVNWSQAQAVFLTLLVSPVLGFFGSAGLLLLVKALVKRPELFEAPKEDGRPPLWIRGLLMLTCTGVSWAHGNNDGQKGMGLIMLILIGVIPASFALNLSANTGVVTKIQTQSAAFAPLMQAHAPAIKLDDVAAKAELEAYLKQSGKDSGNTYAALATESADIATELQGKQNLSTLPNAQRTIVRTQAYLVLTAIAKLDKGKRFTVKAEDKAATKYAKNLNKITLFIPTWVKFAVALALGLGTMIGWKRIVVTVGEKIGKEHLTYAQGASAELVAMITIMLASAYKLPVSTTHVLSSGIAGTMAANKSGLQMETLRNIAMAWLLTLPVCVLLGAGIFSATLNFVFKVLHFH